MKRRTFILSSAATALAAAAPTALALTTPVNVALAIRALRVAAGPYAGGYLVAPNGKLNWYFAALGLLPIVQYLGPTDRETYIRPYLNLYMRSLKADYTIDDVEFPVGQADPTRVTLVPSDSDDSYAATFLSLAARYYHASNNTTWWDNHKPRMKRVANRNIVSMIKANGLTSVFQPPRNQQNACGYLMDNCEVYRGLRDFAEALRWNNDPDAAIYSNAADKIGVGITKLFHSASLSFLAGDEYSRPETVFYPGTTCQVFPQVFGVTEAAPGFTGAWNYLQSRTPGWETGKYDPYPWMVLGVAAMKRGDRALAIAQSTMMEQRFVSQRPLVTINELGFYQRTQSLLNGVPEV